MPTKYPKSSGRVINLKEQLAINAGKEKVRKEKEEQKEQRLKQKEGNKKERTCKKSCKRPEKEVHHLKLMHRSLFANNFIVLCIASLSTKMGSVSVNFGNLGESFPYTIFTCRLVCSSRTHCSPYRC